VLGLRDSAVASWGAVTANGFFNDHNAIDVWVEDDTKLDNVSEEEHKVWRVQQMHWETRLG